MQNLKDYLAGLAGQKAADNDGVCGIQCVDIVLKYLKEYYNLDFATYNGNKCAEQVAKQNPKSFKFLPYEGDLKLRVGDVVSFHSLSSPTCGHVGIAASNSDENGEYKLVEQWSLSGVIKRNSYKIAPPKYGVSYTIIGVGRPIIGGLDTIDSAVQVDKKTKLTLPENTFLRKFSVGENVKILQKILNEKRKSALAEDGIFGNFTDMAVRDFQRANNLIVDGIVGKNTAAKLNK